MARLFRIIDKTPAVYIPVLLMTAILLCGFVPGCRQAPGSITLDDIFNHGELTVITRNNVHSYYIYRDQAMGFEYDLAHAFADSLGVRLNLITADQWENMIPSLSQGKGAIIAASMTITPARQKQVTFSDPYMEVRQYIICHRNNLSINDAKDLAGKTVHVRRGTSYQDRLEAIKAQGIDVNIQLHDDIPTQELIRQVAQRDIEVTIADSNIALLNRRYFPNIILAGPISEKQYLGWAVNHNSHQLLERINTFFKKIKTNGKYTEIYNRYYADLDFFDHFDLRTYHRRIKTRLPLYEPIIRKAAKKHGLDWRLIAAQIYQESHFNPGAESHAGAFGLMQLTHTTADSLNVDNIMNPQENIDAGVRHLKNLYDYYDESKDPERLYLALAAYNIGQGHILDARNLARNMNLDPNRWASIAKTLPLLRFKKYYKNAKHGYCLGTEAVEYVRQIMIYYDILKHQGIAYPAGYPWVRGL